MNLKTAITCALISVSTIPTFNNLPVRAQSSGCGSGSSWYLLRIGSPIAANQFRVACNEHDDCYDTHGKTKQECDKAFHNRMLRICARDHNTVIGRPLRIACNGRADAYYTGVLEHAQDAYNKAQAAAKPSSGSTGGARGRDVGLRQNLGDRVSSHRELQEGSYLRSSDGRWTTVIQGDGNLVIYGPRGPIWASNTDGRGVPPFMLAMQSDGNLVIYGRNGATWASNTNGRGNAPFTLVMQNDANLVIYDSSGRPTWASNTCCR